MSSLPLVVSGLVQNSNGVNVESALVIFTTSLGRVLAKTDDSGKYLVDLANAGFVDGEAVTYSTNDSNNNQIASGSFVATGDSISLDITLAERTGEQWVNSPGNTNPQIHNIGGKMVSGTNPFPVISLPSPNSSGSYALSYDSSSNLIKIVQALEGDTYTLTMGYDSSSNLTSISKWVKS